MLNNDTISNPIVWRMFLTLASNYYSLDDRVFIALCFLCEWVCETVEVCVWLDNIGADDQTECLIGNIDMWECDARNTVRQAVRGRRCRLYNCPCQYQSWNQSFSLTAVEHKLNLPIVIDCSMWAYFVRKSELFDQILLVTCKNQPSSGMWQGQRWLSKREFLICVTRLCN